MIGWKGVIDIMPLSSVVQASSYWLQIRSTEEAGFSAALRGETTRSPASQRF